MVQLQKEVAKIQAAGIQVVGVSYDSVDVLKKFSEAQGISFPLLSDEGSKTIMEYGILYKDGLPHPGTFVIDAKGKIRAKLFREGYRDRHAVNELVKAAEQLK